MNMNLENKDQLFTLKIEFLLVLYYTEIFSTNKYVGVVVNAVVS